MLRTSLQHRNLPLYAQALSKRATQRGHDNAATSNSNILVRHPVPQVVSGATTEGSGYAVFQQQEERDPWIACANGEKGVRHALRYNEDIHLLADLPIGVLGYLGLVNLSYPFQYPKY